MHTHTPLGLSPNSVLNLFILIQWLVLIILTYLLWNTKTAKSGKKSKLKFNILIDQYNAVNYTHAKYDCMPVKNLKYLGNHKDRPGS